MGEVIWGRFPVASHLDPPRIRRPRLLVVEEDRRLRAALIDLFAERCLAAIVFANGDALVRHLDGYAGAGEGSWLRAMDVVVVVVDVDSPGRSGLDVLAAARAGGWASRVVLTAGAPTAALRAEVARTGAAALLARPRSRGQWSRLLESVLEGRAVSAGARGSTASDDPA